MDSCLQHLSIQKSTKLFTGLREQQGYLERKEGKEKGLEGGRVMTGREGGREHTCPHLAVEVRSTVYTIHSLENPLRHVAQQ